MTISFCRCDVFLLRQESDERHEVLELNTRALHQLGTSKQLAVVPGATHLFDEPGTLEQVAELATNWFERYLKRPAEAPVTGR